MPSGANPRDVEEINARVGEDLRAFLLLRERLIRDHEWISTAGLEENYLFDPDEAFALRAAFSDIWAVIQPMDISRIKSQTGFAFGPTSG